MNEELRKEALLNLVRRITRNEVGYAMHFNLQIDDVTILIKALREVYYTIIGAAYPLDGGRPDESLGRITGDRVTVLSENEKVVSFRMREDGPIWYLYSGKYQIWPGSIPMGCLYFSIEGVKLNDDGVPIYGFPCVCHSCLEFDEIDKLFPIIKETISSEKEIKLKLIEQRRNKRKGRQQL